MILITYGVDKAIYDDSRSVHNIAATITTYSFKMKKLVHLQFGALLRNRLENRLGELRSNEQHMLDDGKGSVKPLTREEFQERLQQSDSKRVGKEQEIWESYYYTDRRGRQEMVQIAISIKGDHMEAVIDFGDVDQYENFVPPAWLV